jgi:enterochelin esterase family protein
VRLSDGDYLSGSITQWGRVDVTVVDPSGSVLRRFRGAGATRPFAFAAEGAGRYEITTSNPSPSPARYELVVERPRSLARRLRPAPRPEPYPSPRLQALRRQLASQPPPADTAAFWEQVAREGTPLVEPCGADDRYCLVTFLWRGRHATRNVLVEGTYQIPGARADHLMRRVASSDVWYLTLRLPRGARFTYRLAPNVPLEDHRGDERRAAAQVDPLNPRRWNGPADASKFEGRSAVELPGAAPQAWTVCKAGVAAGRLEAHTIASDVQQLERDVTVYLPAGYESRAAPCALLFLFDGDDHLGDGFATLATLDNLIAAAAIPPTVAVFVKNVRGRRLRDLLPNPEFAAFMAQELVPWTRTRYDVTTGAAQTVAGGASAGGLAAAYMGLRHPDTFGAVLSQSGAFWWAPDHYLEADATTEPNWMARQFLASPRLPVRFYLDAGTFEADQSGNGTGDILDATRHLRDVLLAKGYRVRYQQFVGGHSELSWRGTLADALIALLGGR